MQFDPPLQAARLQRRYKRFLADVITHTGEALTLHCPNTGSMRNCYLEGGWVWYSRSAATTRKYPHTWELAETPAGHTVGVNTHRANALVAEAIAAGWVPAFRGVTAVRREVTVANDAGSARLDFELQTDAGPQWLEVKSVTLCESGGEGYFPDSVTARGLKHLQVLSAIARGGGRACLVFCVQHTHIRSVRAAGHIDPAYAAGLSAAAADGVEVIALAAQLSPHAILLQRELPVHLD